MTKGSESNDVSDLNEKVKASIERLKAFEPKDGSGYYLAFSGGKDSVVTKALMDMAGVKYDATYRVTSVDPPELVRFIKEKHPDVKREIPHYKSGPMAGKPITMWNLIPYKQMPPTRLARYCCEKLKESGGDGRVTVTGVRWAESVNRKLNQGAVTIYGGGRQIDVGDDENFRQTKKGGVVLVNDNEDSRRVVESCYKRHKTTVNPIIEWEDRDVWDFIHAEKIPYCELYNEGHHRLGCIGCPMGSTAGRERDFYRWPKYKDAYMRAFAKMIERRKETHAKRPDKPIWRAKAQDVTNPTPQDIFNWWMEYDVLVGQQSLFDEPESDDDE